MVPSIVPSVDASIAVAAGRGRGAIDANRGRSPSPVARTPTRRGGGTAGRVATNASARLGVAIDCVHYDGREGGIEGSNTAAVPGMRRGARPARAFELASNAPAPRGRRGSASTRTNAADPGGSEVMKSVAERVKAARELAKRLADQEASLGGGDVAAPAPPQPDPPQAAPPPPDALANAATDLEDTVEAQRLAQGMIRDNAGDIDAAAAAATAEANKAAAELAQAEAEAQAYAARAVSDMDEAVTRIRQEAAKRVAAAERELEREREANKRALVDATTRAQTLQTTLEQVKTESDSRVQSAESARAEAEAASETARLELNRITADTSTKVATAEEAARVGIADATAARDAALAQLEEVRKQADNDVGAAKMVQEEITRQEVENAERAAETAINEAEERAKRAELDASKRILEAETRLQKEVSAARQGAEGARESAEDTLAEELAKTEAALDAAEELSAIEVTAAREEAAAKIAVKDAEMAKAIAEVERKMEEEVSAARAKAKREVDEAMTKAREEVAAAQEEALEAARTSEAIQAAKDAVAQAVQTAEADVVSAKKKASVSEKEIERIQAAAAKEIESLNANFKKQIAEVKLEAEDLAAAKVEAALERAEKAEEQGKKDKEEAQARADAAIAEAVAAAEKDVSKAESKSRDDIIAAKKAQGIELERLRAEMEAKIAEANHDAESRIQAAKNEVTIAEDDAAAAIAKAREDSDVSAQTARMEAEAAAAEIREQEIAAAKAEAETALAEAEVALAEAELALAEAKAATETEKERARLLEEERENAVNEAKNAATKAAEASIAEARQEKEEAESIAYETIEAAEEAKEEAEAALARLKEEQDASRKEFEAKIVAAQAAAEEARQESAEEKRRRSDLEAGNEMEKMIEFEKRVAKATADLEKTLEAEREQREQAETDLANARHRVESLTAELDTVNTELTLSQKEEFRAASGDERVRAEFAKLQLLLDKKNDQIALLQNNLGIAPAAVPGQPPGQTQQTQSAATPVPGQPPAPAPAPAPVTAAQVKTAEELELETLLSEVLNLQTPVSEAVAAAHEQLGSNSAEQLQNLSNPADTINPDTGMTALQEVYASAYHKELEMRKRRRRLEAEQWVNTQTDVVASHVDEVYHWLGTNPRPGDNGIIYNRRNKKSGFGDGGQCLMHMGYNGWQGEPRQVGMQPLAHDHPARVEYWLDSGGGDWWIADPVYIHPDARVLDFVFSNGEGQYDNAGGRDYHAAVGADDGTLPPEEDNVGKREELLEQEQGPLDATAAHRAGQRAERKFLARSSFAPRPPEDPATAKVVTVPAVPVAGQPVDVFYRLDRTDPKCPLRTNDVFIQGSWNRWTHKDTFGPTQMFPADPATLPGGANAKPAYTAKIFAPKNAHVMDFYFKDTQNQGQGQGNYDSKYGLDYHVNITGAKGGGDPIMNVVNVAVEMAPIAKVGGMGDVVTALSRAIIEKGHNVEVILPKYDCMDHEQIEGLHLADEFKCNGIDINVWKGEVEDVPVTFLQPENGHFDVGCIYGRGDDHIRFNFFCECALEWMSHTEAKVDIIHAHDWSSAPVINARRSKLPPGCATVFTIHNLQFGQDVIGRAMERATFATTVSPTYASEIAGEGAIRAHKEKLVGVRNGIDIEIWDPMTDECLEQNFNADSWENGKAVAKRQLAEKLKMAMPPADHSAPLVGVVARLTNQKGVHMIKHAMYRTVENGGQVVLLGSAPDGNVQNEFNQMANDIGSKFPGQSGFVFAYDEPLSHLIYAASDILLVPSMFEPCGLTQMIAMRYGTVPVVRRTGGLRDTVFDVDDDRDRAAEEGLTPNGFSFDGSQHYDIEYALDRAMQMYQGEKANWDTLVTTVMRQDWGWTDPADTYVEHYWKATKSAKYAAQQGLHRD